MTAYRLHHEPGTVAVLEHIRAGAIGRPLFFQSVFSFQTVSDNHRLKATAWGGPLQDVGVYCINAARHIFAEEPIEAIAMAQRPADDPRFGEVDASVAAMLRFPSGGLAQFVASFGAAAVDNYRVVGTSGDLELDPGFQVRDRDDACGCAATERSSRPSFRKSTISARRSDISRIASGRERRLKQMAKRGWRTCAH